MQQAQCHVRYRPRKNLSLDGAAPAAPRPHRAFGGNRRDKPRRKFFPPRLIAPVTAECSMRPRRGWRRSVQRQILSRTIPNMALSLLHDSSLGCVACAADRGGGVRTAFLGGARYGRPLDATNQKKFLALRSLGELFVIGYSRDLRPRCFSEHARFYLLPQLPLAVLRYLE